MKISKSLCKYPDTVIICDVEQRGESLTELKAWLTQAHIHKRKCLKTAFMKLLLKMLLSPCTPSLQHSVMCCSGMACPVYYLLCFYLRRCLITLDFLIQSKLQQPCGHFKEHLSPRHRCWTRSVILSPFKAAWEWTVQTVSVPWGQHDPAAAVWQHGGDEKLHTQDIWGFLPHERPSDTTWSQAVSLKTSKKNSKKPVCLL